MEAVLLALAQAPNAEINASLPLADKDCKDTGCQCSLSVVHQPASTSFIADQGHQQPENVHLLTASSAASSGLVSPVPSALPGPTQTACSPGPAHAACSEMPPSTELFCSARSKPECGGRLTARRAKGYLRQQAAGSFHSKACIPL